LTKGRRKREEMRLLKDIFGEGIIGHVGHHCPENGRDPSGRDFHSCHPGRRERERDKVNQASQAAPED